MSHTTDEDAELVRAALTRSPEACRKLVVRLTPVVRQRVAKVLLLHGRRLGRAPSSEDVDDLQHDVFVLLFDRGGRVLQAWDPARGLSLQNFVGLVAQREAAAMLRSGRRSAWAESPCADDVPLAVDGHTPERHAAAREELGLMLEELRDRLSPRGLSLFEALFAEHQSVDDVCARFGMTPNALYAFRSRLQTMIGQIQAELACNPGPASVAPVALRVAADGGVSRSKRVTS